MSAVVALLSDVFAPRHHAIVVLDNSATITFVSAAAAGFLGYGEASLVGRDFRSLLGDDHALALNALPLSRASYEQVQLVHDSGVLVSADLAITAISGLGVDAHVLAIKPNESEAEHERHLRDELMVEQYCHSLNLDLIKATTSDQLSGRIRRACKELGALTECHTVFIALERPGVEELEPIGCWIHPDFLDLGSSSRLRRSDGPKWREAVLSRTFVVNDINEPPYDRPSALHMVPSLSAFISIPLFVDNQRGVVVLTRRSGPHRWRSFDSRMAKAASTILADAFHRSRVDQFWELTREHGPIGFSIRTAGGHLVDCNRQYLDLYGLSPNQVEAQDLIDRIHPDDRDAADLDLRSVENLEQNALTHGVRVLLPDGGLRHLQLTTIVKPEAGQGDPFRLTATHEVAAPEAAR